jgi:secreted PhoX family phosphatase
MNQLSRRRFINLVSAAAAGTTVAPLGLFYSRPASAECLINGTTAGFGPLSPTLPLNTHELVDTGPGNLSGFPLLELPKGFAYTAISITGQTMSDGSLVPGDHDGMACFARGFGHWRHQYLPKANRPGRQQAYKGWQRPRHQTASRLYYLVRNHELSPDENEFGNTAGVVAAADKKYDPMVNGGGTTTLIVDHKGRLHRDYASLAGTVRNCAGGPTPWRSWISCEENIDTPAMTDQVSMPHGYNFEVPAFKKRPVQAVPLVDMGRFNHEAIAVDPKSGYVYQTEDRGDSAFYRFIPRVHPRRFGDLQKGGDLYAMAIDPDQFASCDGTYLPTSTSPTGKTIVNTGFGVKQFLGQSLAVSWVKIDDVDPVNDTVRKEAQNKGAAIFRRGEGMWYDKGLIYFVATTGGNNGNGQVWVYNPARETVTLVVESTSSSGLDNADNITVAPDGSLYLCEDSAESYLVGVDRLGRLFKFARNNYDLSEFAGACFSPDGRILFVNQQGPGATYCIFREDGKVIKAPFS